MFHDRLYRYSAKMLVSVHLLAVVSPNDMAVLGLRAVCPALFAIRTHSSEHHHHNDIDILRSWLLRKYHPTGLVSS
jgi:hypothetical protein